MQTTLNMAERKRELKVTGFHESMGGYGKKLLAGMGINQAKHKSILTSLPFMK